MPIYEYEPTEHDCLICSGRFEVMQSINDSPLKFCPTCGMPVRRVISKASIQLRSGPDAERAAKKGFTTYRKSGKYVWEKVAGQGADVLAGTPEDIKAVEESAKPKKNIDLDKR